ncbi:leucine rich adaptor protein 1 [Spea bombifrons]|uniref:leucine rich adaptor protein 1 n=1 Tax=Spea bombifrons TaxID=233779 RepID=UPI00234BB393|nr:leucine rich adaptor protein 1 [Spea bombifrons]
MDQSAAGRLEGSFMEATPDLRDLESKVGRKTPEGLLRWMREDPVLHHGEAGQVIMDSKDQGLGDKIKALKVELACLRAIDVKILHQLLAVNEGIEAVKWILEEKGNLTSRCSSLTSSQYSLAESQETSRRGSWNSLQDPTDKLDSISIGSYLDTLADDLDEYSLSTSEPIVSSTPHRHGLPLNTPDQGVGEGLSGALHSRAEREKAKLDREGIQADNMSTTGNGQFLGDKSRMPKQMGLLQAAHVTQTSNRSLAKHGVTVEHQMEAKRSAETSPKMKLSQNGKVDLEKLNSKLHLEYDAHWQWVQSQDDVTFL